MRKQFSPAQIALGHSFKQACANNDLDTQLAAPRYVGERFLAHWHAGMGPSRIMIKGGYKFGQADRPTQDCDIVTVRRYSNGEIQRGFGIIAERLAAEGITLSRWSSEAQEIETGHDPVVRYKIEATLGTIRANVDLDISTAIGPDAFPRDVPFEDLPRMFKAPKWPTLHAQVQPDEAAVAEKWIAVIMQDAGDYRVKHLADVISYNARGVDLDRVAEELIRVCRHRGIPISVCAPSPPALRWPRCDHRESSWNAFRAKRNCPLTYDQAWIDVSAYWADTHRALTLALRNGPRRTFSDRIIFDEIMAASRRPTVHQYIPKM
ncbi:nucleotidyl transferase AbiEii/AbiGii toxin family protein [Allorhizobium borbori]|uniref:Nucleotidyl transferase AbiEii toxin, Type IV TA system n=1 Tax=Allorhizobium borbori TaxID=485907 RepID=A0A7W6JZF4_9HYPH|nr:nucleotidyl transferase AbiEii/AbiGii toxin family protein [Allorhizobium borbori]MBB4102374.1 hypothetical protein [Allorhizobium borbori]